MPRPLSRRRAPDACHRHTAAGTSSAPLQPPAHLLLPPQRLLDLLRVQLLLAVGLAPHVCGRRRAGGVVGWDGGCVSKRTAQGGACAPRCPTSHIPQASRKLEHSSNAEALMAPRHTHPPRA